MKINELHCTFALLCIINAHQISSALVYNVKPSNSRNYTSSFCFELNDIPTVYFESNVQLHLLAGDHKLLKQILIQDVRNFSMIGQQDTSVKVLCTPGSGQIFFRSSVKLSIANITFMNCGAHYSSQVMLSPDLPAVIVYYRCIAVQIVNTTFQNSYGHSIIAISIKGISTITDTSFFYNQSFSSTNQSISGILFVHTGYNLETALILEHCTFNNISSKSLDFPFPDSLYHTPTALLTLIQSSTSNLLIHILNSNFVNCTWYTGPLISVQYNSYGNMNFLLHNVTIYNNEISGYPYRFSLIELNHVSFPSYNPFINVTEHQVEFRQCLISSNTVGNIIRHLRSQVLQLNVHLIIHDCIFSYNKVIDTFMLMENCLTVIVIKNSKYIYNEACILHAYDEPSNCAFFISCTDAVIFTGLNEFSFNILHRDYFWVIDNYIILEENTLLNFSSNSVGEEAMIKINQNYFYNTLSFPLCPIQYVSYRGSLSKEFTSGKALNFSLIFHNNFYRKNSMPYMILGKKLKDCEWLPESTFAALPPGIVTKKFVHFDYPITSPITIGHPYHGCLCYKDNNTDCLTDEIGPVYPGQTVEIGFVIIIDTEFYPKPEQNENFFQDVLKYNSSCQMEVVTGTSGLKETTSAGICFYLNYSITFYHPDVQECIFVYYFQNSYQLYNKYYVSLLACPPGFLFANGKCICHPNLKQITQFPTCNIVNQSVLRPGNVWIMYSNATGEIMYTLNCPIQYCSSFSFYIQLVNYNHQCINNRKGLMCGECAEGFSATFGSSRCKICSNIWLTMTAAFMVAGLLLIIVLFAFKIDIVNTNTTGLILYANIISLNSFNILTTNTNNFLTSSAIILISSLNLDLGFELCFYNEMTEYAKLWLQFAFPVYLILLTSLLLFIRKHIQCVQRLTRKNGNTIMAIMILLCGNKIITACQSIFFYNHLKYLESDKSKYLWSVYPSIPLFDTKYLLYFLFSIVLVIILTIFNVMLVFSKKFFQGNHFIFALDGYQGTLKEKHMYWPIVELLLRFITTALSVLNKQLSVLLNTIVIIVFVCCLGIASPFKDVTNTLIECTFAFNLVCIFACTSYYGDSKTTNYYILVDALIFIAATEFVAQVIYYTNADRFKKVCKYINKHIQISQKRYKKLLFRKQWNSQANYESNSS